MAGTFETKVGSSSFLDEKTGGKRSNLERQIAEYKALESKYDFINQEKLSKYIQKLHADQAKRDEKEAKKLAEEINKATSGVFTNAMKQMATSLLSISNKFGSSIESYINTYTQYMGRVTTRLQGSGLDFSRLAANISKNLGTSPYLKQTDMLANLNKFVESGISYNLETRAYIATATDKIATTFDAFDSSILRLIRVQQADSTIQRLGIESLLTKFLNTRYQDTSYLSNNARNVTANLFEAEALMGYKGASQFEYAIQRGLGMMGALGVSDNTINAISQGLGYLGSGNIAAIAGNTPLQNLLVMAASRAGLPFGGMLTQGVSPRNAASLLQAIVGLGQDIANSGNNVVMSQYANIFGLTVSDLISLTNVTANDLKTITSNLVTYEQLTQETQNQLYTMSKRTTTSEMVKNVLDNMMTSLGANIASNPVLYGIWEVANLVSSSGLDPTFEMAPFGVGTSLSLSTLTKSALIGASGLISIGNAMGNLINGNGLGGNNLSMWSSYSERRGTGLRSQGGVSHGVGRAGVSMMGSLDSGALTSSAGELQEEAATYAGEDTGASEWQDAVVDHIKPDVKSILDALTEIRQDVNRINQRFLY